MRRRKLAQVARRDAGFTLVEVLVVLAIIGLLASMATPPLIRYLGKAKTDTAKIQIQALGAAVDMFRLDNNRYPTTEEGLQVLATKPTNTDVWNGPYVKKETSLLDPWGQRYQYRAPGEHGDYDLFTLGADKAQGGTGENADVGNWQ